MLRNLSSKKKSIADKVAEILQPSSSSDEEDNSMAPRVADFDFSEYDLPDARSTDIRKKNVKLLYEQSARYKGKIASRKDFEQHIDNSEDIVEETEDNETTKSQDNTDESEDSNHENSTYEYDSDKGEVDENDSFDDEDSEEENVENLKATNMVTETNRHAEIEKGTCVQNQLRIWEKLLELRIHSQKLLSKANQLSAPLDLQQQLNEQQELQSSSKETVQKTGLLLKSLLELQNTLSRQFPELKNSMKTAIKRSSPFHDNKIDDVPPTKRIGEQLQQQFDEFKLYRNAVLLKWDDRTKLLTPGAGAKKKSMNEEFDVIRKIETALMNRSTLIEKSQICKNANATPAAADETKIQLPNENEQSNANIYDDSDFYHQQLRELIEYKANTSSNMTEVTKQYVELQKLRQKMKKKVDVRASKGRKLRYVVHNKLVNFTAPDDTSTWTEESKNELCKSLFSA